MRSQKRNPTDKAFTKGYQAAIVGRSWDSCPFSTGSARLVWMNGWREGREDYWQGFDSRTHAQKLASF